MAPFDANIYPVVPTDPFAENGIVIVSCVELATNTELTVWEAAFTVPVVKIPVEFA